MDAHKWDERYAATELVWSAGPNQFVREILEGSTPGRVLDVACGEGRNAIWLAEQGWDVTGTDFSGVALDKARQIAERRGVDVRWVQADATSDALVPDQDLSLLCYLQLPSDLLRRALAASLEALRPGGRILVIAHAADNLTMGVGGPQDLAVLPCAQEVADHLMSLAPHCVLNRVEQPRRQVNTPEGPREAIDLLVLATLPSPEDA